MTLSQEILEKLHQDKSEPTDKMAEFEFQMLKAVENRRKALKPESFKPQPKK